MGLSESEEIDLNRIKEAAMVLGEHYDTVQIFVTRHESETEDSGGTMNANYGVGNWFARYGFVRDWCVRQDEQTRIHYRKSDD